jgi:hypothetical protein
MQKSNLGIAAGSENTEKSAIANPQQPAEQFALEHPEQQGKLAGAAAVGAAGAAAPALAGPVARLAAKHPMLTAMAGSEAIRHARQIPVVGKMIPPYAEMAPFLFSGGKGMAEAPEAAEGEAEAMGSKTMPETAPEPAPTTKTMPEATETKTPEPGITNKAASQSLSKTLPESLGNEPIKIKPGVKIRDQFKTAEPKESSVVKSFDYNPETKELSVKTPNGNTYVHAEVTPEEAEGMKTAESKGEYWNNQIRANHRMVNKIMPSGAKLNSVPTNFRGVSPESGPEDVMPNRGAQLKGTKGAITSPESQDLTSEWSKAVQDALTKKGKTMGPPQ